MDIIINDNYELIVSKAKKAADKTEEIKKDLAKIRAKLDDYYDGRIDFDSDIKAIEKRLGNQADNMMKLANAIDDSICGLVETDRIGIQAVTTAAKNSIASINLSDTSPNSMVHSVKSFISNFTKKAYDTITDMFDDPVGAFTGTLVGVGTALWSAISGTVLGNRYDSSGLGDYTVDISGSNVNLNNSIKLKLDKLETVTQIKDRCTTYAVVNLLRRKQIIEGGEASITAEDVRKYNYVPGEGYYWKTNCCEYIMKNEDAAAVKNKITDTYTNYLIQLLDDRPEGIVLYAKHDTNNHAITITDYEIVGKKVQFYVMDPSNSGTKIKLEDSCLFASYSKDQNMNAEKIFSTKMIRLYYVK